MIGLFPVFLGIARSNRQDRKIEHFSKPWEQRSNRCSERASCRDCDWASWYRDKLRRLFCVRNCTNRYDRVSLSIVREGAENWLTEGGRQLEPSKYGTKDFNIVTLKCFRISLPISLSISLSPRMRLAFRENVVTGFRSIKVSEFQASASCQHELVCVARSGILSVANHAEQVIRPERE